MESNIIYSSRAICMTYNLSMPTLEAMVESGIVEPYGKQPGQWFFSSDDLHQIEIAAGYYHYLGLEPEGAVVAAELCNELDLFKRDFTSNNLVSDE